MLLGSSFEAVFRMSQPQQPAQATVPLKARPVYRPPSSR